MNFASVKQYVTDLTEAMGDGWNRFWFSQSDAYHLTLLRICAGILGLCWLASYTFDLARWFGADGLLPYRVVYAVMTGGDQSVSVYGFSQLSALESNGALWAVHSIGMAVLLLFTAGVFPQLTGPLSLAIVLGYVHRAPMLAGNFEPILCLLLLYLSLAFFRVSWSWKVDPNPLLANIATRLIQVHLAAIYLMTGLTKLGHTVWWTGEASWELMAQPTSLIDFSFLRNSPNALDLITHGWVFFDLSFGVLIWNRWARPILIACSFVVWTFAAIVTGLVGFSAIMIVANLAFIPPKVVAGWLRTEARLTQPGST